MPTKIYGSRTLVYVAPFTGSAIKYGFLTGVDSGTQTALGHTVVTGAYPPGLVIGANAPKPPRARRKTLTATESSFCNPAQIAAARAAGWQVSAGKVRVGSASTKSVVCYITYEGNKIAWRMPRYTRGLISGADFTGLGITEATRADEDLVYGVRYPQVPRVSKIVAVGAGQSTVTTFCDPSKLESLPEGWITIRASKDKV